MTKENPLKTAREAIMRERGYITPLEASRISKTPLPTIYTWVREGALKVERTGRRSVWVSTEGLLALTGATISNTQNTSD